MTKKEREQGLFIIRQIRNHLQEMMFHAEEDNMKMVKKKIKDVDAMLSVVKKVMWCPMEDQCPILTQQNKDEKK